MLLNWIMMIVSMMIPPWNILSDDDRAKQVEQDQDGIEFENNQAIREIM